MAVKFEKKIRYKVFFPDGSGYGATMNGTDFKNYPEFTLDINGGLSEMKLTSSYGFNDWWYDDTEIMTYPWGTTPEEGYTGKLLKTPKGKQRFFDGFTIGAKIEVWVDDIDGETQIYSGIYTGFEFSYAENGERESVHHFIPNISILAARILKDGSDNTTVAFNSQDPADIFKYILNSANTDVTYNADSIFETGVSRTYSFNAYTCLEALRQTIKLTPNGWIWFVGGDDLLYLKNTNNGNVTTHRLSMNKLISFKVEKSIALIRNSVIFLGGGDPPIYKKYDATGSQNSFGVWEEKIADESVTDEDTADVIVNRFLGDNKIGFNYFTIEIADSNFSDNGYDIESIKPGDKIIVDTQNFDFGYTIWGNFYWGIDYWLYDFYAISGIEMIVKKINYKFTSLIVDCAYMIDNQEQRIEDIQRDLTNYRFKDAPSTPTT